MVEVGNEEAGSRGGFGGRIGWVEEGREVAKAGFERVWRRGGDDDSGGQFELVPGRAGEVGVGAVVEEQGGILLLLLLVARPLVKRVVTVRVLNHRNVLPLRPLPPPAPVRSTLFLPCPARHPRSPSSATPSRHVHSVRPPFRQNAHLFPSPIKDL